MLRAALGSSRTSDAIAYDGSSLGGVPGPTDTPRHRVAPCASIEGIDALLTGGAAKGFDLLVEGLVSEKSRGDAI